MDEHQLREFLQKLADGNASATEHARFNAWVAACTRPEYERMLELWEGTVNNKQNFEPISDQLLERINASLNAADEEAVVIPMGSRGRLWTRIAVAASLVIVGSYAYWLLRPAKATKNTMQVADVAPGTGKAILRTASGKQILLDSAAWGQTIVAGNNSIKKSGEQQLTYTAIEEASEPVYDTIQIPVGGKPYQVMLGDGSKILLNAATTLRLPENMSSSKRGELELITGEIYADIRHNENAPLTIKTRGQVIEDLGTKFNIEAYADEDSKTTLEEGVVKVNSKVLSPGKQAVSAGAVTTVRDADIEQTLAWTKGYFRFNGEDIQTIMKELARWYNIDVVYEGKVTTEGFYGKISRSKNISEVLKMLEKTKSVHFKIEGRRITVLSKT